jgi:hypothetical protein
VRSIDPNLFTRLMWLPDAIRVDLLEFLGSAPIADIHLSDLIERISAQIENERLPLASLN